MDKFLGIAIVLIIIWVIASVTKWVVGILLHLLWVAALVFLVVWLVRKFL